VFFGFDSEVLEDPMSLPARNCRIAFRDITNRTNSRTMIAALLPPDVVLDNKAPYFLWQSGLCADQAYLLGVLCSTPFDWYARRFVELNVNFFIFNRFPIPEPGKEDSRVDRLIEISGRLAAVDSRYQEWADAVGVPVGSVSSAAQKSDLVAELDAVVAHLYGLNRSDLEVIWETFHTTVDHLPDLETVQTYFEGWKQ